MLLEPDTNENILKHLRAKLLESYKNGAYAERRKAFTDRQRRVA